MKSAALYFSVSLPLIKENLRRYWAIPVIAFLVYFLSGVFRLLISYDRLDLMHYYILSLLNNSNPIYVIAHLILPIVTGVIVFRYLQTPASTTSIHSMPFTRAQLFNSTALSGLILTTIPIIVIGIILLLISKPVFLPEHYYEDGRIINVFARADILSWMGETLIIFLFLYAVTVIAGLLTGNSILHLMAGFGFNFLLPAIFLVYTVYCDQFLYGFIWSHEWDLFNLKLTPYLYFLSDPDTTRWFLYIIYILVPIALLCLSMYLYYKRALERATDSFVFGFMLPIATSLIAFFGMSMIGFYFIEISDSDSYLYFGFMVGAVMFFLIGTMITRLSFRVFDRHTAKSLGIYSLLALVFILAFTLDLTGFEKRVPNENNINSISFTMHSGYPILQNFFCYDRERLLVLTTVENIRAIREYHKTAINNRPPNNDLAYSSGLFHPQSTISYNLPGVSNLQRRYSVDYRVFRDSKELAQIYESKEYKSSYSIGNDDITALSSIELRNNNWFTIITGRDKMMEFIACFDTDFQTQKYTDAVSLRNPYANITFGFSVSDHYPPIASRSYSIPKTYSNTIEWIRNNGYSEELEVTPDMISSFSITKVAIDSKNHANATAPRMALFGGSNYYVEQDSSEAVEITDKEQIAFILDTAELGRYSQEYYTVYSTDESSTLPERTSYGNLYYYYNDETVPDFIKELFE